MSIKSKFLGDAGWKDLSAKNKLKDNGLAKALEKLRRIGDEDHDDQTKVLEEVVKLAAQLKKDKAVASVAVVVRYLAEMQGDAELTLRDVAKAKAEHDKAQKAKAEAEKAAAKKARDEDDDEEEESPELLTTKLKPLLKLVAKGDTMHALLAKSGKQVVVMLSRKPIPPARRKMLAEQLGGGSTKYYPGTCGLEAGATTFALKAEVAGMSKLVKAALLQQTGLRLNKLKCRGEDGDDDDNDDGDEAPMPSSGKAEGAGDATMNLQAAAPDEEPPGGLAPGGGPASAPPKVLPLTIVTLSGASQFLTGSTERFRATVTMPDGSTKDVTAEVTWDPSDPGIAISSTGDAEIKAPAGPVTIAATHPKSGAKGSITVTVVARILKKITITPKNPLVEVDQFVRLRATGEFSDGTTEDVTERVSWGSNREEFARASALGHVQGRAPGKVGIWAGDNDAMVHEVTEVTVHAAGKGPKLVKLHVTPIDPKVSDFTPLPLRAMGEFADKSTHEVTDSNTIRWVSARPRVLAVNDRGLATPGLGSEVVRITAVNNTDETVYGYTEVDVALPRLEAIEIAPRDPTVPRGESVDLVATGTFSSGPPRVITNQLVWTSLPAGVVLPVTNTGLIQSVSEGKCDITATDPASQLFDTVAITVSPPVITSIDITPAHSLQVNATQQYVATATFSGLLVLPTVLTGPDVKWLSSDPATLAIDLRSGMATAKAPGPATITVTTSSSRVRGTLTVTVKPIVTKVRITPQKPTVKVGDTLQLNATATLADGKTEDRTDTAYWATGSHATASVDKGQVTGVAAGPVSISATSDGEIGTTEVEVTP